MTCLLSMHNRYQAHLAAADPDSAIYMERTCIDAYKDCRLGGAPMWDENMEADDLVTLYHMTLDECKDACLQHDSVNCRLL